jgi:hypothetical protein
MLNPNFLIKFYSPYMKKIICLATLFLILHFQPTAAQSPIVVTETSFKLPILGEESFYFGFAEGDQVSFSFEVESGKELKEVEIIEFPSSSRYKELKTSRIQNKMIPIAKTGIFQFRFANTVALQKICKLKIERIPASQATANFNSTVYWRTVYDTTYRNLNAQKTTPDSYKTVSLVTPTSYYLESSSSEGKQQLTIPINLPDFTSEWYYAYAATDKKEQAENLKSSLHLAAILQKKISENGGVSFSVDSTQIPTGTENCRIYLLDQSNQQMFESRGNFRHFREGTRENAPSGLVKIKTANFPNAFLGIKNSNAQSPLYVTLEVVAVIAPDDTVQVAESQSVNIRARKEPYLQN